MQVERLRIVSNDPLFGPPAGTKEVNVIASTAFDPPPVAVLSVCQPSQLLNDPSCVFGEQSQATVSLASITSTPKTLTLSGVNSTDSNGTSMGRPTEYRFQLMPPLPAGVSTSNVRPNTRGTADRAVLTLSGPGVYRVSLTVWDASGQQGQPVTTLINVTQ